MDAVLYADDDEDDDADFRFAVMVKSSITPAGYPSRAGRRPLEAWCMSFPLGYSFLNYLFIYIFIYRDYYVYFIMMSHPDG